MKQQQITYDKGITYVPSDALCSDNALSECVGMTCENGEMKPIQKPEVFINSAVDGSSAMDEIPVLLYIHKFNNEERYIGYIETNIEGTIAYLIVWGKKVGTQFAKQGGLLNKDNQPLYYTDKTNVTSVGKILIVSDDDGIEYSIWDNSIYTSLGGDIPLPNVQFRLINRNNISAKESGKAFIGDMFDIDENLVISGIAEGKQEEWNNLVVGLYSKAKKDIAQKKAFHGSFCVRTAIELYDGTFYHISNPIFMLNQFSTYGVAGFSIKAKDPLGSNAVKVTMQIHGQELQYKWTQDYSKWSDIVKNVVVFVTKEAYVADTTVDAIVRLGTDVDDTNTIPITYYMSGYQYQGNDIVSIGKDLTNVGTTEKTDIGWLFQVLQQVPDADLSKTIKDGVYYKLCEIGTIGDSTWKDASDGFDTHTLETLTTQTQLGIDDYYSNTKIKADYLYPYNSRLNLAGVERGFFDGFHYFMPFDTPFGGDTNPLSTYTFYVTIKTDGGDITVSHTQQTRQIQGIYFFYPDPRAKRLVIKKGNDYILDVNLTEHPTLNGAFYFAGVSPSMVEPDESVSNPPSVSPESFEVLPNYIITSEVNNPFVFRPEGYFKVGTGKIIGCSTVTQALSEGQFGQFPLLVFSESGIWALTVGSTGYYTSIHPISREVCSNAKSITQTDGAVYFVSEKGLMIIVGSAVKCVSEQMDGRMFDGAAPFNFVLDGDFESFLKDCRIAYDYRDSQLVIINESYTFQWVYNMKSSTFSKAQMVSSVIDNVVNDYPDNLLQLKDDENGERLVYSLFTKPDQNLDDEDYGGVILTRPMKLENGLALKTIMDLKNIRDMEGDMELKIYGSNNLRNWREVNSLTGVPWKYYRFKIVFEDMKATDRFSGTVLVTQERRTNKLR